MRVPMLVLGIIGSMLAILFGAIAGLLSAAALDAGDEVASAVVNMAMISGAQGIIGLIGSVMAFIALGKGNKATIGGVLLLVAVVISLWSGFEFPSIGFSNALQLFAGILAFIEGAKQHNNY